MSLVESWPSTEMRSNERLTQTPSSRSAVSGSSAASVWTKQSIVAKLGWIIPAPLAWALIRTVPDGSATSSDSRFSNASVVAIARQNAASPSGASSPRAARIAARDAVHRQRHADHAGRGDGDAVLVHAGGHRAGALHAGGVLQPAVAGGGVRVAGVDDDGAQRVEPAARLAQQHRRGEHARAREARGARPCRARRRRAAPRSGSPDGLIPAGTPAARKPAASPPSGRSVTVAGGSTQREAKRHAQPLALVAAEHQVQVLHGLRRGALPQVVDRGEDEDPARRGRRAWTDSAAVVRLAHLEHAGRPEPQLHPRLARVRVVVELRQLVARRARAPASRSRRRARPGRAARGAA